MRSCPRYHTLGSTFEYVARTDVPNCVESLSMLIERQNLESDTIYLVGLGLDRVNLTRRDPISGESAVDGMRKYLLSGPGVRAHLIAWWTSMSSFNSTLGFEGSRRDRECTHSWCRPIRTHRHDGSIR